MDDQYKQNLIHRLTAKPGKTGKIEAKCVECVYDPTERGTWRKQVENCGGSSCPLYEVRPKSLKGGG